MTGPAGGSGESEYPTRDAETAGGATARPVAVRRGVPFPDLPRPWPALCRRAGAGAGVRRRAGAARRPRRRRPAADGPARARRAAVQPVPVDLHLRPQPGRAAVPARGDHRCLPRRGVHERPRRCRATAGSARPGCRAIRCLPPACSPSCSSWPGATSSWPATTCSRSTRSPAAASSSATTWTSNARPIRRASPEPSESADPSAEATPSPTPEPSLGSQVPEVSVPPWDGRERLNILLIGADEQGGGHNTDTLITVSIDPVTKQVAMFSLPRDTSDVPIPSGSGAIVLGPLPTADKINSFFVNNRRRSDLWPGNDRTRGYNGLKAVLGELYDLDIKYFVEVNFEGFKKVVDAVGGVTINVQVPVVDDAFPGSDRSLAAAVHPERHPAHGRRAGAALRPLAEHLHRLRPRRPAAARAAVAPRAGRPADPAAAPARAHRSAQEGGPDRHPARPAR